MDYGRKSTPYKKMQDMGITNLKVDAEIDFGKTLWIHLDRLSKTIMEAKFNSFMNGVLFMENMMEGYLDEEYEKDKAAIEEHTKHWIRNTDSLMQQALMIHRALMRVVGRAGFLPEWKGTMTEEWKEWDKKETIEEPMDGV